VVGTIEPRKNLLNLLDAYARRPKAWRAQVPLILVGMPGWGNEAFWRALREHRVAGEVWMTGYLPDAYAAAVVAGAQGLFYPSFYEGFGLPVLEAMSLGVPVAASTADSVREVCGDAALLVHPDNTHGWSDALARLSETGEERDRLTDAGRGRSAHFRWETVADMYQQLFGRLTPSTGAGPPRSLRQGLSCTHVAAPRQRGDATVLRPTA
jgi:alpha-1,3-rhamnosyl/mannosyltransferase